MRTESHDSRLYILQVLTALLIVSSIIHVRTTDASDERFLQPIPENAPNKGLFLVASREMSDPRFRRSVVLLLEHDPQGTLGVIVNRETEVRLGDALPELSNSGYQHKTLYFGGPVALNTLMFLIRSDAMPLESAHVLDDIYHSSSRQALEELLPQEDAGRLKFFVGYSGWGPGQLDAELSRDDWRLFRAQPDVIFSSDLGTLWERFMKGERQLLVLGNGS